MSKPDSYVLKVGAAGMDRLAMLNSLYEKSTKQFLMDVGLRKDMHIANVGCGYGHLLTWLAEQVGQKGSVTAIDISNEQIEIAKQSILQAGFNNVQFYVCDIYNLQSLSKQFDLVYAKFLLMHLYDYKKALKIMYQTLKPNGILACEELENSTWFTIPSSPIANRRRDLLLELGNKRNLNYNMANELPVLLGEVGCKDIYLNLDQPVHKGQQRYYLGMILRELKDIYIQEKLSTEEEMNYLILEAEKLAEDKSYILIGARKFQTAGYKR